MPEQIGRYLVYDRIASGATAGEMARDLYSVAASMGRNVGPTMMADLMLELCARWR